MNPSYSEPHSRILSFKQFVTHAVPSNATSIDEARQNMRTKPMPASKSSSIANPQNLTNPLPTLLTFQRKEVRMFSDGRIVGRYREVRTGVEIVFPQLFR